MIIYAKLFTSIYQGTLRGNSHGLLVFTNLLAHCDKSGRADIHPRAIAEEVGLSIEQVRAALDELEAPDEESRSPECEGRRITRLDEHRAWGWTVVNYVKYRSIRDEEDRREQNRLAQEKWRIKHRPAAPESVSKDITVSEVSQHKPQSAHTEAEAYTEKKDISETSSPHPSKLGDARFDEFWKAYPRKVGKDAARRAFAKRKPTAMLHLAMLAAIAEQIKSEAWRKDSGQFIPNPATWLNQGRWQDDCGVSLPSEKPPEVWKPDAPLTEAERVAANEARMRALSAVKRMNA
jgi:hypothetical protein